jgi:very-short-patch-repair endonuclease
MPWANQYAKYRKLYEGTASEHALEPAVASLGIPYRWQMPVGNYFLDFALPTLKVAIEVDGASHDRAEQKAKDKERTAYLEAKGWRVVRCTNAEAQNDPYGTVERLCRAAGVTAAPSQR